MRRKRACLNQEPRLDAVVLEVSPSRSKGQPTAANNQFTQVAQSQFSPTPLETKSPGVPWPATRHTHNPASELRRTRCRTRSAGRGRLGIPYSSICDVCAEGTWRWSKRTPKLQTNSADIAVKVEGGVKEPEFMWTSFMVVF